MPVIQPIDLTKPSLNWKWLLSFFLIILVLLLIFGFAMWVKNSIARSVAGEETGHSRVIEEPKI